LQVHDWWLANVDQATDKHLELPADEAGGSLSILNPLPPEMPPPTEQGRGTGSRSKAAVAPAPAKAGRKPSGNNGGPQCDHLLQQMERPHQLRTSNFPAC
jgi:hypothetical protein